VKGATTVDEYTLAHGDLEIGPKFCAGILTATANGQDILIKDASNRKHNSMRDCIPNGTDVKREYATYLFAKMVPGLVEVPAMALRNVNGADALAMEIVQDAYHPWGWDIPQGISITVKRNMALFDAVVGNTDRHCQNFFVSSDRPKRVIAIDHGLCFPLPSQSGGRIDLGTTLFLRGERLPKWCINWLNKILAMEFKIRRVLSAHIEYEAIEEMFKRVNWMLDRGRFMDSYDLRSYSRP